MRVRVLLLLCTVFCVFTVTVALYTRYTFRSPIRSVYCIVMHEISPLWIPKQRPFCKSNLETGSRDYKVLNPKFRD